ncbi:MAG: NADH-quinone oxidoreductase subunit J family protein [Verrucomicrobiota bacterium JB025]|nr:NADH-quinone oxidoreductase subunit J [Verrucomicrobiota bacterium JB025]
MPSYLFWFFAIITLIGGISVIAMRNPVSSAMSVVVSFVGLAGLFVGLSSFFAAIIQILVYTGAIMVLFLFIIMLLDLKTETKRAPSIAAIAAGLSLVIAFTIQLVGVITHTPNKQAPPLDQAALTAAAENFPADSGIASALTAGTLPDTKLIGHTLFTDYNFPLQILGLLLLVSTIGVVVLSNKSSEKENH